MRSGLSTGPTCSCNRWEHKRTDLEVLGVNPVSPALGLRTTAENSFKTTSYNLALQNQILKAALSAVLRGLIIKIIEE